MKNHKTYIEVHSKICKKYPLRKTKKKIPVSLNVSYTQVTLFRGVAWDRRKDTWETSPCSCMTLLNTHNLKWEYKNMSILLWNTIQTTTRFQETFGKNSQYVGEGFGSLTNSPRYNSHASLLSTHGTWKSWKKIDIGMIYILLCIKMRL